MNFKSAIKNVLIGLLIMSSVVVGYASVSTLSSGEPVNNTVLNAIINLVNQNESSTIANTSKLQSVAGTATGITISGTLEVSGNVTTAVPTDNLHSTTKSYVDAAIAAGAGDGSLIWAGYITVANNGDMDGVVGANELCGAEFADSRWATYDELVFLGSNYPNTDDVWVVGYEAVYNEVNDDYTFFQSDNNNIIADASASSCAYWTDSVSGNGMYLEAASGIIKTASCSSTYKIACVK